MQKFSDTLLNWLQSAQPIVIAIVAISLFVVGVMFIWPNERSKEKAKEAIPWVVIGCAVALGAVTIAHSLTSSMTF